MSLPRLELSDNFYTLRENAVRFAHTGRVMRTYDTAKVYEENKLNELIKPMQVEQDSFDEEVHNRKVIRFVLDGAGKLRFGKEGGPSKTVPAHSQLAGASKQVLAAGNLYFNAENELVMATHKSGDYQPDFYSLLLALIALYKLNEAYPEQQIKFAADIIIQQGIHDGFRSNYSNLYTTSVNMLERLATVSQLINLETIPFPVVVASPSKKPSSSNNEIKSNYTSPVLGKRISESVSSESDGSPTKIARKRNLFSSFTSVSNSVEAPAAAAASSIGLFAQAAAESVEVPAESIMGVRPDK
ncbi:MAG: hypothetical protein P4M12_08060 [Gammaproteobacteria bacterium]|nr:hypothetical protein [Gammaproteobacteria bacterium]